MNDGFRVVLTERASDDLDRIYRRIAADSPINADRCLGKLLDRVFALDYSPGSSRVAGRSRSTGVPVHAFVEWPYVIYYQVHESRRDVVVLTVRHGARRQPRRFE